MNADKQPETRNAKPETKTLVGIVTFGNVDFTRLAVRAVRETAPGVHIAVIIGLPGDAATQDFTRAESGPDFFVREHRENVGLAASCNDLWNLALNRNYEHLILMGNDVVPYPGAIRAMVECAETTNFEWIAASQFDVKSLTAMYPATRELFTGENYDFKDFTARPWEAHAPAVAACVPGLDTNGEGPSLIKDVQNLCLFKPSVFDKLGYFDVNFWPNGYFSDNDYARRAVNARVRSCALTHAQYFHFWSRTIHQGGARPNGKYFEANRSYYASKWGGAFGAETLTPGRIGDRAGEAADIAKWRL